MTGRRPKAKRPPEAATIKEQIAELAARVDRVEMEGFIRGLEAARRLAIDYPEFEDTQAHANRVTVCNVCDALGGHLRTMVFAARAELDAERKTGGQS